MIDTIISCSGLHEDYKGILRRIAATAQDFELLLRDVNEQDLIAKNGYNQRAFQILHERAESELLSVAFFGAFSSGKSFLISGLNDRIDIFDHKGKVQYAPLLPSSPRPTSSCPVAVEPLPADQDEDDFWVYFEGADNWEQKDPAKLAVIQAYVTNLPNVIPSRLTNNDRKRTVLKAKLGIKNAPMKARFYDLPGFGSIGDSYEKVIREFVQKADCIVYLAWGIRPLDINDLQLLRDIYNHHKTTGKPVFFVLTQIDVNADQVDPSSGKAIWEDVLDANNEFINSNFIDKDGKPDRGFIGGGFIPVSAALEAIGQNLQLQNPESAAVFIKDSGMGVLRDRLNEYLQNTSGPMHLAELALEIQKLLTRLAQDIQARKNSESIPLDAAFTAIKGYKAQRGTLIEGKFVLEENLANLGRAAIKRAFAKTDPDDLCNILKTRLENTIKESEVLDKKVLDKIEDDRNAIVREWVSEGPQSLLPRWVKAWDAFIKQSNIRLENLFETALEAHQQAIQEDHEIETPNISPEIEQPLEDDDEPEDRFKDTIDLMSTTWQTWVTVAGIGASSIAGATLPSIASTALAFLGPVGWGILATAGLGLIYGQWRRSIKREAKREDILNRIPLYANEVVAQYRSQADESIKRGIGEFNEKVDNKIASLSNSIESLEQRLLTGEYIDRTKRLETLHRLLSQCVEIDNDLKEFYKVAARLQPGVSLLVSNLPDEKSGHK